MRLDDDLKFFETPEFKDILERYETAHRAGLGIYMEADELTDVAEYYAMVKNNEGLADEAIDLALQLHPDAVDPQIFRARQYMLKGDIASATHLCNAIQDQSHREVFFLRAELMLRANQEDEACSLLFQAMDVMQEDVDYFLFDSAYIFIDYDRYDIALKFAHRLEEMAPKWFKTWELFADIYLAMDNFSNSLNYIEKMLDCDPFYISAWNWRTEACCGLNDYAKAIESADYALAIEPQNERALELKAWVLMRQENFEQAHALYSRLQDMNPSSEIHCLYDSYCLFDLERLDESQTMIERAEVLADGMSQEQAAIYEHHAHIFSERGLVEEALHYIDLAEEVAVHEDVANAEPPQDFDYYRARIYADNGDTEHAIHYIHKLVAKHKEPTEKVMFQGAQILFESGDYATALLMFNQLEQTPVDPTLLPKIYPYLAVCYHETGDADSCLANIRLAIDNKSPEMKELLGYIFAEGVLPNEYYDYYYYRIHGQWPM